MRGEGGCGGVDTCSGRVARPEMTGRHNVAENWVGVGLDIVFCVIFE